MRRVSDKDGLFEPLLQSEIAELLDLPTNKINAHLKDAMQLLKSFGDIDG